MAHFGVRWTGFGRTVMSLKAGIVSAIDCEVTPLLNGWQRGILKHESCDFCDMEIGQCHLNPASGQVVGDRGYHQTEICRYADDASFGTGDILWAKPETIGAGILEAVCRRRDLVYLPWFWRWIMWITSGTFRSGFSSDSAYSHAGCLF